MMSSMHRSQLANIIKLTLLCKQSAFSFVIEFKRLNRSEVLQVLLLIYLCEFFTRFHLKRKPASTS